MPKKSTKVKNSENNKTLCSICGEPIDTLFEAISEADGTLSHFDCVINKLTSLYKVEEPDKISYIGNGCFGICTKDEEGKYSIKEKIQYESTEAYSHMKSFVQDSIK